MRTTRSFELTFLLCLSFPVLGCYGDGGIHVCGIVKDVEGKPIPGAEVELRVQRETIPAGDDADLSYSPLKASSDQQGQYDCLMTFPPNSNVRFLLIARKTGFQDFQVAIKGPYVNRDITMTPRTKKGDGTNFE